MAGELSPHEKVSNWLFSGHNKRRRAYDNDSANDNDRPTKRPARPHGLSPPLTDDRGSCSARDIAQAAMDAPEDAPETPETPRARPPFQNHPQLRSSKSRHSSVSSSSRKRSSICDSDSGTARSSAPKRLRNLEFSQNGFDRQNFGPEKNKTLPQQLQDVLGRLREIDYNDLQLPYAWRDVVATALDIPPSVFQQNPPTDSPATTSSSPIPESLSAEAFVSFVNKISRRAQYCDHEMETEAVWSDRVYQPILEWACDPEDEGGQTLVSCHDCTQSKVLPVFQSEASSCMVDYCLVIDDNRPQIEDRIKQVRASRPSTSINHSDTGSLAKRPIGLSVELKNPGGNEDKARLQLGTWLSAQWRSLTWAWPPNEEPKQHVTFLPSLHAQGSTWSFHALVPPAMHNSMTEPQSRLPTLWSKVPVGNTDTYLGICKLIVSLWYLISFLKEKYWPAFQRQVLGLDATGVAGLS